MFAYAFAKGVRQGLLEPGFLAASRRAFAGLTMLMVTVDVHGYVNLHHIAAGTGLGGKPYRDGSYDYYTSAPQRTNDVKEYAPLLHAAIELEKAAPPAGSGGRQENTPG